MKLKKKKKNIKKKVKKVKKAAVKKAQLPDFPKIIIGNVTPRIHGGIFPIKKCVGDKVTVQADIYKDGHDTLVSFIYYRPVRSKSWLKTPMTFSDNDRFSGEFQIEMFQDYEYCVVAFVDSYHSWRGQLSKKVEAGEEDLESEMAEGEKILVSSKKWTEKKELPHINKLINRFQKLKYPKNIEFILKDKKISSLLKNNPDPKWKTLYERNIQVKVIPDVARYGAWYEMFPRSQGTKEGQSGTFKDCIKRLKEIHELGFNIIYLPPIHPIGLTNRKGKNNSLSCEIGEPGSPYAIGNKDGGHKAIHKELGSFKDFENFIQSAKRKKMAVALDFALNCSPDHPYVKNHPNWFYKRPDGSIKYAENPPKKYQDIYPLNLYCDDWKNLWNELKSIIVFWIKKGVKIFRVDNPHTKPVYFWEWLIGEIHIQHPDVFFLSEAFTKPKMMKMLAKVGFEQSYTYFTWRNEKNEIINYFNELTLSNMKHYFIGNLFTNTPDILPFYLQSSGQAGFKIRFALAATLSTSYGIYSGFELCESGAIVGREEYYNSEKYEYKVWDWDREGNIKSLIKKINLIRKQNKAFHHYDNVKFHHSDHPEILCYSKEDPNSKNFIFIIVNLNPHQKCQSYVQFPSKELGFTDQPYQVQDLVTDQIFLWQGDRNYVVLDPKQEPVHILKLLR